MAALLKRGALRALPMGYLIAGRIGTGKTFIVQCWAGEIGIPCVVLKNFRSKYVGETEGNLRKIFAEATHHAPSVILIDEVENPARDVRERDLASRSLGLVIEDFELIRSCLRDDQPLQFWAILSEGALRQQVGGREVMQAQLAHLIEIGSHQPNVNLQVLPFAAGANAARTVAPRPSAAALPSIPGPGATART